MRKRRVLLVLPLLAAMAVPVSLTVRPAGATTVPPSLDVGPAAVSPVVQSGPTSIVRRVQDTYVTNANTSDHSAGAFLHIGTTDTGATRYRSFLQFDVSRLAGATIESATLRLYNSYTGSCAGWWMYADPVAAAWNQSTITWSNQPGVNSAAGVSVAANFGIGNASAGCPDHPQFVDPQTADGIHRLDVTEMVKDWIAGTLPNYGLRLYAGESDSEAYKDFCSMNPGAPSTTDPCTIAYNAPTLEITYNTGHPVVAATNAATKTIDFYDAADPTNWRTKGPFTTWAPDAYHSITDSSLLATGSFDGATDVKLRPGGPYGDGQVLVVADGGNGFVGVIPFPALSGRKWAINIGTSGTDMHAAEMMPDGNVALAITGTGRVQVFSAAQGQDWAHASHTPVADKPLEGVHQVLYDPDGPALWAIGNTELVRYAYAAGTGALDDGIVYPLPPQTTFGPTTAAYGHDITTVRSNPERLWVAANGGITQFSKSAATSCAVTDTATHWPDPATPGVGTRWCNDFPWVTQIGANRIAKSIGDDPVSGRVLATWPAPGAQPPWTTNGIAFYSAAGQVTGSAATTSAYYRARWLVPAY